MYAIVGLGNHGSKYQLTRHNIGFLVADGLHNFVGANTYNNEKKALVAKANVEGERALLIKPQTYMNNSGESVTALLNYYKIDIKNLIVIQDDIDQEFGKIKLQQARGHGGHNGIRNIHQLLGTNDYVRLKFGVGRPNGKMDVADYVLQNFNDNELEQLKDEFLGLACDAVSSFVKNGFTKTANIFNAL